MNKSGMMNESDIPPQGEKGSASRMKTTKTSMQSIADSLGISKAAVSLALNGKTGVSEETRTKVLEVAQRLNYGGLNASEDSGRKILVLIPDYLRNDSYFYHTICWSIEAHAKTSGYTAILYTVADTMQNRCETPDLLLESGFAGIITIGTFSKAFIMHLQKMKKPLVSVDQYYDDLSIDSIVTSNTEGCYRITRHVIRQGHKQIGFIGPIMTTSSLFDRWCGFQKAMIESDLPVNPAQCVTITSPLTSLYTKPEELDKALSAIECMPTAFICGNDRMALAAMEALKKRGFSIPNDISIAGFDNIELAAHLTPPLTTVAVNREELGIAAVDRLLIRREQPLTPTVRISVVTKIVQRESILALPY